MKSRGIHLQYSFQPEGQSGAELHNPLFDLLSALRDQGSIQQAARAMGASYRHVWGQVKHWEGVLGEPLVSWTKGQPARLTPFSERLLAAEARARARWVPHIEALRAELEQVFAEALDGRRERLSVWASHDLALPGLREPAAALGLQLELRFAGSMDALRALAEGRCAVAGFHVPPLADNRNRFARGLKPLLLPGRHKLIGCMRRRQGLLLAPGNPLGIQGLADLAARGARFVNRQPGSGTRLLVEHLLATQKLPEDRICGFHDRAEDSHLAVAAAVAAGQGDAALGIEAAAVAFGLDFVPLADEDYYLVCLAPTLEQPAVGLLRQALGSAAWMRHLQGLAGYQPGACGEVLSLTRALPWWHFRSARPVGGKGRARPPA